VYPKRTHTCGELRKADAGKSVVLNGWVDTRRDHGGVVFLDVRDRYGLTQVVCDATETPIVSELRSEFVVAIEGKVRPRPPEAVNPERATGEIEVVAKAVHLLNRSETPPFEVTDDTKTREDLRLEYRYVDLRRRPLLENIVFRGQVCQTIRRVLTEHRFNEIETPLLMKTTPEGARDFIVPSRVQKGSVYALPQSPQLFKQVLMVSGLDRYFQICKCLRDEDLRADRQPEFTQLDMEMSFVEQDDVFAVIEDLMVTLYGELQGITVEKPFDRLGYDECMRRFGSDKPERRFGLELFDVTEIAKTSAFKVFQAAATAPRGKVVGLCLQGGAALSRKEIDDAEAVAKTHGAKGLAWIKLTPEGPQGPIVKFLKPAEIAAIAETSGAKTGDLLVFVADQDETAQGAAGQVRLHWGRQRKMIDEKRVDLFWVVDFPLFGWNQDEKRWEAKHHMFTSAKGPLPEAGADLSHVLANLYDLVLNGNEIASGSIRIHRPEDQQRVFDLVGISREEADRKFGWFLRALEYGAPPHGGIALGLDRIVMIMRGAESLRDVIAFPKTASGSCLLTGSPSPADAKQWEELGLAVRPQPK
jgi:aspartyl-tRNA synthetase